jgi:DNA-nicking Smr family endonuclease
MSEHDRDDDTVALFRRVMAEVRPLKQDKIAPYRARQKPIPRQTLLDQKAVLASLLSDEYDPAELETGEELLFARPGLQHTLMRKFRRGQFAIEAELDLHGRVVVEAREMVNAFLREARTSGLRCVRIIHGKGLSSAGKLPVLKGKVNAWLRQKDEVLAFCSARPVHGGTGAVYVLLKRPG